MTRRRIERGLWLVAAAATSVSIVALRAGDTDVSDVTIPVLPTAMLALPRATVDSLEQAVGDIGKRNLFRPERAMADVRSVPTVVGAPMPAISTRPRLLLRGVLGGPPWDALVEGIPGHEGAVVMRAGQTLAGITIRAIHRDTVFVRGLDTTWTLTLGRSW
jgi:hypothetical protein